MPKGLPSGLLRHRVEWQTATTTPSVYNQQLTTWTTVQTLWAFVEPKSGVKKVIADQLKDLVSHVVHLRGGVDINPKDRLLFNGRVFNADSVINVGEYGAELLVVVIEETAGS